MDEIDGSFVLPLMGCCHLATGKLGLQISMWTQRKMQEQPVVTSKAPTCFETKTLL